MKKILLLVVVFLVIAGGNSACATSRGPGVTEVGVIAQHNRNIQLAATTAANAIDTLIFGKVVSAQEADPILLAIRGIGQAGKSLADALDAYRIAKTPEARDQAAAIVSKLQSSLMEGVLALPDQTKQKAVWARIQPLFQAIATAAVALSLQL